jgi:hypothetical protein
LQRALSAQQAFGISSTEYAIPTPKVLIDNKKYERIYNFEFIKPKQYIRIQRMLMMSIFVVVVGRLSVNGFDGCEEKIDQARSY